MRNAPSLRVLVSPAQNVKPKGNGGEVRPNPRPLGNMQRVSCVSALSTCAVSRWWWFSLAATTPPRVNLQQRRDDVPGIRRGVVELPPSPPPSFCGEACVLRLWCWLHCRAPECTVVVLVFVGSSRQQRAKNRCSRAGGHGR